MIPSFERVIPTKEQRDEFDSLSAIPELKATPFPFRGHQDFRGFTQEDYDNFNAGLFMSTGDPSKFRWFGGRICFDNALMVLERIGYVVETSFPGTELIGDETDGYDRVNNPWFTIRFEAQTWRIA